MNDAMEKVGLIIQGPLLSFGKSGSSASRKLRLSSDAIGESGFAKYDCRANIQNIINEFGNLFSAVVISTWEQELKQGDEWKGATLVAMPDPGAVMDTSPDAYKANNRNRQFIGIKHGLDWLEKNSESRYVVQMRTDQYINLQELLASFTRHLQRGIPGMICVPFMRPGIVLVHDFYLASEFTTMRNFLDAQLSYDRYEFIVDVHRDMVLKYAYTCFREYLHVPDWAYFPRAPHAGMSKETKKIFTFMFQKVLFPLSERTLRSVEWRGSLLSEDYRKGVVTEEHLPLRQYSVFSIPSIFSIHWERYYEFCRISSNFVPSWKETIIVQFSEIGWSVWITLLQGMRMIKRNFLWMVKR